MTPHTTSTNPLPGRLVLIWGERGDGPYGPVLSDGLDWDRNNPSPIAAYQDAGAYHEEKRTKMIVEEGKYYRAENGEKIGPMSWWDDDGVPRLLRTLGAGQKGLWREDGSPCFVSVHYTPRLIAEWTDEPDLTAKPDYNDGNWHGWNGGECPVDPRCMVEAVWHDPASNAAGMTGPRRAEEDPGWMSTLCWEHVVKFRVTKPATPQPEPLADRLQRILTDGLKTANNEGATLLAALDLWAAERGVKIKEG